MSGTVNISRDIWSDTAFKEQPFTEREAFMWMVMEASWKPREKRIGSVVVSLERGQLAASIRFMANAWNWQKSTVDRFLKRLENRDMIGTASGTGVNVITIRKYNEYQNAPRGSGTPQKAKAGQQRDSSGTNENKGSIPDAIHKVEANASTSRARKRASRLPDDWRLPREWGQWALGEGWSEQAVRAEADKFRDYWIAASGQKATKRDWFATWRNWLRNVPKEGNHGNRNRGNDRSSPHSTLFAAARSLAGDDDGGSAEPSENLPDVTPSGETGLADGQGGNASQSFFRIIDGRG